MPPNLKNGTHDSDAVEPITLDPALQQPQSLLPKSDSKVTFAPCVNEQQQEQVKRNASRGQLSNQGDTSSSSSSEDYWKRVDSTPSLYQQDTDSYWAEETTTNTSNTSSAAASAAPSRAKQEEERAQAAKAESAQYWRRVDSNPEMYQGIYWDEE